MMTLFNDTDLFTTGTTPKREMQCPDMELMQYDGFIPKEIADNYYTTLLNDTLSSMHSPSAAFILKAQPWGVSYDA